MTGLTEGKTFMISQPMNGISEEEILQVREEVRSKMEQMGFRFVDSFFNEFGKKSEDAKNIPVYYLSKSIEKMSQCDIVVFVTGWEKARGCQIEHAIAEKYEIEIRYYNMKTKEVTTCDWDNTMCCCISPEEASRMLKALKEE